MTGDHQHDQYEANADISAEHDREEVAPDASLGELLQVDPRELIIGANVRGQVGLDREFVRSIRDRGVREPIQVRRRTGDGALVVRKGKRRTLGAIEAGQGMVRVLVEPDVDPGEDDTAGQVERIVDQLEENLHRLGNSEVEEVAAHQQLLDLGLTAGQIARRTHTPVKRVKVTTAVARSEFAAAVLARYDIPLDRVAVIAEFDDGTEKGVEAIKALTVTAQSEPAQFEHVAQRLRDQREEQRLVAERVAELTAAGVRVVTEHTDHAVRISGLRPTAQDPSGTELTLEAHQDCPGHSATVDVRRSFGARGTTVTTSYLCTDPDGNGHIPRWDNSTATTGSGSGTRQPGPMSEAEKAERRRVIANNKDWDSATTVRRDWLQAAFLARKTAPKDAARFIATTLGRGGHDVRKAMESGHATAQELLGMDPVVTHGAPNPIALAADTASPTRATMLALAVLLGAAEQGTGRHSWRNPSPESRAYFTALRGWGYPLSPVEQLVLTLDTATTDGEPSTDAASDENQNGDAAPDTAETDTRIEADDDGHERSVGESEDASGAARDGGAEGRVIDGGEDTADVA
ncbi:ParB/RepB/Spo0J family partition protein [Pseudonocardia alaniniphila]|uniref:ParB N-terminal domain-containing protein n=1 Tax=Pseudonocardia alaniniphila TaxID=75291 RepID=A0ABS9T9F2_9PSEU|nr:ParB N-terminal domain-containing protein [Pseudonocardia alaniniphila]MCH6165168.1 ParB N-terminal domain-containing protein [Pseudonocardia alaniniphila]